MCLRKSIYPVQLTRLVQLFITKDSIFMLTSHHVAIYRIYFHTNSIFRFLIFFYIIYFSQTLAKIVI